jgi:uncharacterized protein (TIGR03435 family)
MNRLRSVVAVAALSPCLVVAQQSSETPSLGPMAADASPSIEVATIRPSIPGDQRPPVIQIQKRRWMAINRTVMELITYSHSLHRRHVLNAPGWLDEQYDITAQPDGAGQPSQRQWHAMVRKLLADRFKLSSHTETREVSVYVLTVKDGPKALSPGTGDPAGPANLAMRAQGRFAARNASMADLASELGAFLDRPVVDRTGVSGRYDFTLLWTIDEFQSARLKAFPLPQRSNTEVPNLFTAIQEQLGLKLDAATAPASVLVIDRIERPSEN